MHKRQHGAIVYETDIGRKMGFKIGEGCTVGRGLVAARSVLAAK